MICYGRQENAANCELVGIEGRDEDKEGSFEFRPVGYGVQDFPSILKASEEAGAQWVVVEQDQPSLNKTALECAQMSRDYLREIGL